ncbi:hypothetical protein [Streptomyces sp. NPDC050564]|uniref:hypothetical protein n=1 Tax=Streptomyces sp. NPDC050564 TaxID=3365631 RepID=UPI00378FA82E
MADDNGSRLTDDSTSPSPEPAARGRLRSALRWVLLIYALVVGAVAGVDLLTGDDLSIRMDGAVLGCLALVTVLGCAASFSEHATLRPRIFLLATADISALLTNLWLLSRIQSNFVWQIRLTLVLVSVSATMLIAAFLAWGDVRQARHARPVPQPDGDSDPHQSLSARATMSAGALGAVGTLLAASLALPQFWYAVRYKPYASAPVVSAENEIKQVRNYGGQLEITATITLENSGDTPVTVLVSMYEITGSVVTADGVRRHPHTTTMTDAVRKNYGPVARYNTYATYPDPHQIQVGTVVWDHAWLGPGEKTQTTVLAHAPRSRFNLLRITTDVAVARADQVEVDANPHGPERDEKDCDGTTIVETRQPIRHAGLLDLMTESDRELVTLWVTSGARDDKTPWWPAFPWINASLQHTGHPCTHALNQDDDGLESRAMLGWAGAIAEAGPPTPLTTGTRS